MNFLKFPLDNQTCPIYFGSCNTQFNFVFISTTFWVTQVLKIYPQTSWTCKRRYIIRMERKRTYFYREYAKSNFLFDRFQLIWMLTEDNNWLVLHNTIKNNFVIILLLFLILVIFLFCSKATTLVCSLNSILNASSTTTCCKPTYQA